MKFLRVFSVFWRSGVHCNNHFARVIFFIAEVWINDRPVNEISLTTTTSFKCLKNALVEMIKQLQAKSRAAWRLPDVDLPFKWFVCVGRDVRSCQITAVRLTLFEDWRVQILSSGELQFEAKNQSDRVQIGKYLTVRRSCLIEKRNLKQCCLFPNTPVTDCVFKEDFSIPSSRSFSFSFSFFSRANNCCVRCSTKRLLSTAAT